MRRHTEAMTEPWAIVLAAFVAAIAPIIYASLAFKQVYGKLDMIHVLVNSRLEAVKTELADAKIKIGHLEKRIEELASQLPDPVP